MLGCKILFYVFSKSTFKRSEKKESMGAYLSFGNSAISGDKYDPFILLLGGYSL